MSLLYGTSKELPLTNECFIEIHNETTIIENGNIEHISTHQERRKEYKYCLKVAHLNKQSMKSPFNEFQVMLQQDPLHHYPFRNMVGKPYMNINYLLEWIYVETEESVLK